MLKKIAWITIIKEDEYFTSKDLMKKIGCSNNYALQLLDLWVKKGLVIEINKRYKLTRKGMIIKTCFEKIFELLNWSLLKKSSQKET